MLMWVTAGAFFMARFIWNTKIENKHAKIGTHLWPVPFAMFVLAAWSLLLAPLPFVGAGNSLAQLGAAAMKWVGSMVAGWFGGGAGSVALLATLALIFMLVASVADLWDRQPDGWVKTSVWLIPMVSLISVAPIATRMLSTVHSVQSWGGSLIGGLA